MKNEEKMPLFTRLNDAIDGKIDAFTQYVAKAAEDKEGISDDIVRGGLRTLGFIGNLPVIKQIGQLEEGLVSQVGKLAEQQDLIDPRSFTYSTRIGTAFIPYFGAAKAVPKVAKAAKNAKVFVKAKRAESAAKKVAKATKEKYGDLKMTMMANIDNPKNPFDSDDALTRRYYEINNPDSYDTDPLSPTYGKLKSEITFTPPEQFSLNLPDIDPITSRNMLRRAMDNNLLNEGRLDYGAFLTSNRFKSDYRRLIAGDYATPPSAGLPYAKLTRRTQYQNRQTAFNNYRRELVDEFKDIYGDDMSRLGFTESRLDLDHRLTLVQSLGMLHNTAPGDKLWKRITEYAIKRGYTPGDARPNLGLIDPETHRVKSNFFNDLHGLREGNLKYWNGQHRNTGKTRFEIMSESHLSDEAANLHMEVVEDYFDVVDQGDKVLRDAQAIFKAEYKLDILPEEIAEELMPVILSKQYSPKIVQGAIKDIVERDKANIRQLQEQVDLFEFIDDYERYPDGPLTRQEYQQIDPKDIADAKKEFAKLRRVNKRKSYIQRLFDKRERTLKRSIERDKESGQLRLPIDD